MDINKYGNKYMTFGLIFMLSNRIQTIGDNFLDEITAKQWFILLMLSVMEGHEPTLNELSEAVGSSHQNVKQLVLKLEKKGFVELFRDKADARYLRIKTTAKYMEYSKAYEKKNEDFIHRMYEGLQEENLNITKMVLLQLQDNLAKLEEYHV